MKTIAFTKAPFTIVAHDSVTLLPVELKSPRIVTEMINEFGFVKTIDAIQALYDADVLNDDQANAMLYVVNDLRFEQFAHYGECEGFEGFEPIKLH